MRFGAHLSAAGGHHNAIQAAGQMGLNTIQVFAGSPRTWRRPDLSKIDLSKIKQYQSDHGIETIVTHALYLINLASNKPETVEKSMTALQNDLEFDALVGGLGVVVHTGSYQKRSWKAERDNVAERLSKILQQTSNESTLLLENAASRNGKIGGELAEIKWLLEQLNSPRLGWCLDTCHAWAAGYHLTDQDQVDDPDHPGLLAEIDRFGLWDSLKVVHVNDSRDAFASNRDLHGNLGDGQIGTDRFKDLLSDQRILALPMILEVPGIEGDGPDQENVDRLREIVGAVQ